MVVAELAEGPRLISNVIGIDGAEGLGIDMPLRFAAQTEGDVPVARFDAGMSRRALVTGASGGIGRAIAVRLAADGATVICSGRNVAALEETSELVEAGRRDRGRAVRSISGMSAPIAQLPRRAGRSTRSWPTVASAARPPRPGRWSSRSGR